MFIKVKYIEMYIKRFNITIVWLINSTLKSRKRKINSKIKRRVILIIARLRQLNINRRYNNRWRSNWGLIKLNYKSRGNAIKIKRIIS